jgi:hypothetical protein
VDLAYAKLKILHNKELAELTINETKIKEEEEDQHNDSPFANNEMYLRKRNTFHSQDLPE